MSQYHMLSISCKPTLFALRHFHKHCVVYWIAYSLAPLRRIDQITLLQTLKIGQIKSNDLKKYLSTIFYLQFVDVVNNID